MKRILSVLLALVMVIGMFPMGILSASAAEQSATLSFADKANRTVFTTSQQVWVQNGITLTNDKASSTNNVADYANPARFYAKSSITIAVAEGNNITKIEFTANSSSYATALMNSAGAEATASGSVVTIIPAAKASSYEIASMTAQVRANSVTVYYEASTGACAHTATTEVAAVAATCTGVGYTAGMQCNECLVFVEGHEVIPALGHDWSDWAQTTAPGCVTEGVETSTCANCSESKTQAIEATGHTYVDGVCSGCGKTQGTAVATQITTAEQFVSGKYVLVVSSGAAMGALDGSWVTAVQPEILDGAVLNAANGIWTLTVNGSSVTIVDANGVSIAPKGGNENGIISGEYSWAWSVNEDGTFVFAGVDTDTVQLASNTGSENKFRAYKTATISGNTSSYLANFAVYKMNEGGEVEPDPEEPTCEHTNQTYDTLDPTCEEDGYEKTVCADCGEVLDTEVMGATGHDYVDGTCTECGEADPNAGTDENGEIIFELGENGDAAHKDGTANNAYSETVGKYTLSITATDKMYTGSLDAKGNSCIKLGTGSVVGGFSFTAPDDVTKVIIRVAKYKANNTTVNVNGTNYTLTQNSNDGAYDEITVDTSTSKTVTVTTVSGGCRAMVNSITFVCSSDSEADHTCVWDEGTVTEAATCLAEGVMTYSCTVDGCDKIKTEAIAKTGHAMTNGTCSVCGAEYYTLSSTLNNNDSVVIYYPASKVALTATASGNKLSGATVTIDESGMLANSDLAIMQVQYLEGSTTDFYLICDGKYLTSGATGNSLTFAEEVSDYAEWYIEIVEGGDNTVYIHNRNAAYNGSSQSMEFYSGFTTYTTKTTDIYKFQLYTKGENAIACEHGWSDWEIVTNATCTTAGEQKSVCANCGVEKTETIAATGHTYVFGDTEVTCTAGDVSVAKSSIGNVPKTADSNMYYVEGVVTFVDGGTVYIQDATGGVALRLASGVTAPDVGTLVEAIGSCSAYNGLIQLQDADFEAVSTDNDVNAQEITLSELMADTDLNYLSVKVNLKGLTITEVGDYSTQYKNIDYTVSDGINTIKLYRAPLADEANKLVVDDVINVTAVVSTYNGYQLRVAAESDITKAAGVAAIGDTQYYSFEAAYKAAGEGDVIKLLANAGEDSAVELTKDLYVNLNGFLMTASAAEGTAYTVYGMDSCTDSYEAEKWGNLTVTGATVAPLYNSYLAVDEGDLGWSFHAYSAKLTFVSLDPTNDALGYKAQFYGDEMVLDHVTGFGYNLWVNEDMVVTKGYETAFTNGQIVTLRLKGIMAADGGEMEIFANAYVTFDTVDGQVTSKNYSTTMRETIEKIEANVEANVNAYSEAQMIAIQGLIATYESKMEGWNIDAIKAWGAEV